MIVFLRDGARITLPESIIRAASLREGDALECTALDGEVHLAPVATPGRTKTPLRRPSHPNFSQPLAGITCFRKFSLRMEGEILTITNRKAAELIAYLACARGEPVSKVEVATALWPDADEKRARNCLYKACGFIRFFRGGDSPFPLVDARGEIWIDMAHVSCDLIEFERLYEMRGEPENCRRAIDLYRGPLLYADDYDWAVNIAGYYEIRWLEMLDLMAEYCEALGDERLVDYYRKKAE